MIATTNQDGSLNLFFPPAEARDVLRAIQNPSLPLADPPKVSPAMPVIARPTKNLKKKTIELLKELRDIAGIQQIGLKNPDYLRLLKAKEIRPGNFTVTLWTLAARGLIDLTLNAAGTRITSFAFKPSFKI